MWTDEHLIKAVKENTTIADVLRQLNLNPKGGNYRTIHKHVKRLQLDTSHWIGQGHLKGKKRKLKSIPLESVLVTNSFYPTSRLKKRLIDDGILHYQCSICSIDSWNQKHIVLQLDHINGEPHDNRLKNLRLLCPNCHSQTDNYCGRNMKQTSKKHSGLCAVCGNSCNSLAKYCRKCAAKSKLDIDTKINWPDNNELIVLLKQSNFSVVARQLGVSDNAIRNRLKRRGLWPI